MALEKLRLTFMDRALGVAVASNLGSSAFNTGTEWLSLAMDPVTAMAVTAVPAALYGLLMYKITSKGSALVLNNADCIYIDKPEKKEQPTPAPVVP